MFMRNHPFGFAFPIDAADLETLCPHLSVREFLEEFEHLPDLYGEAEQQPEDVLSHPRGRRSWP